MPPRARGDEPETEGAYTRVRTPPPARGDEPQIWLLGMIASDAFPRVRG